MSTTELVHNRRVLDYDDEVPPDELQHRDTELQTFIRVLKPFTGDSIGGDIRLYGPSGAGKTTLAKFATDKVADELGYEWAHVDCLTASGSTARVLYDLCDELGLAADLRRGQASAAECQYRLDQHDTPIVAILDEGQHVEDVTIYQRLFNISDFAWVVITTSEDSILARTDINEQIRSRLRTGQAIHLSRFTHAELRDILEHRVDSGLRPDAVTDDALDAIADVAAGNAREAIAILARAVDYVQSEAEPPVTADVITRVKPEAREQIRRERLKSFSEKLQHIFTIVAEADGGLSRQSIQDRFEDRHGESLSASTVRRHLRTLQEYEFVEKRGDRRGATYHADPVGE